MVLLVFTTIIGLVPVYGENIWVLFKNLFLTQVLLVGLLEDFPGYLYFRGPGAPKSIGVPQIFQGVPQMGVPQLFLGAPEF